VEERAAQPEFGRESASRLGESNAALFGPLRFMSHFLKPDAPTMDLTSEAVGLGMGCFQGISVEIIGFEPESELLEI
jgi:hypothetical protein